MKKEKHFKILKLMKLQVILLEFQNKFQIPKLIKIKANIYKSASDYIDYVPTSQSNENTECLSNIQREEKADLISFNQKVLNTELISNKQINENIEHNSTR